MCTAIIRKGRDVICGFNFDITKDIPFKVCMDERAFWIGIDTGIFPRLLPENGSKPVSSRKYTDAECAYLNGIENGIRKIEGVNCHGQFAVHLGSQDNHKAPFRLAPDFCPIDSLLDDYISGKIDFNACRECAETMSITNQPMYPGISPAFNLHGLLADRDGRMLLIEPGTGYAVIKEKYFVLTNFDLLEVPMHLNDQNSGYFGLDRYITASRAVRESGDSFNAGDALGVLESVRCTGDFATRCSFVYSNLENRVYYTEDGDFGHVKIHNFRS